jgi:TRAP-type C4-dicarboxylate transport system permease small subunit
MVAGVHRFWADHHFEEIGRRMEQAAAARQSEAEQLNQKKEQIQKGKEGLNNALKNIKTRFGKLGLEVEDAILLAPVAFSAIFLIAALNLCKNIQLRKSFHRLFQARDPQKVALTDSEIALAMPLWLDPLAPPKPRKVKAALLLIPAIASALTLLVVFYCWTIPDAFTGLTGLDYVKYLLYYMIGVGLFIFGFQKVRSAIKNYSVPLQEPLL